MNVFLLFIVFVFVALFGLSFGKKAKKHPELFWQYLIAGCLITTPLMIGEFTWYEEIFALFYLFANLPVKLVKLHGFYRTLFAIFILYLIFQSFRGMVNVLEYETIFESARKIRWPFFFLLILGLFYKSIGAKIEHVSRYDLAYKVSLAGLFLHCAYLLWGVYALAFSGSAAFTQQAMLSVADFSGYIPGFMIAIWGATAYVHSLFPVIILAVLITLGDPVAYRRKIATFAFLVISATVVLFDSRSGGFALVLLTFLSIPLLGVIRIFKITMLAFFVAVLIGMSSGFLVQKSGWFWEDIQRTLLLDSARQDKSMQDIDRRVWLYSAVPALSSSPISLLLGYGWRMSGYIVAPYVYDIFDSYGVKKSYTSNVGTEAITNIAVDTGLLGLVILMFCFLLSAYEIYVSSGVWRWIAIASLGLSFAWLFVINISDSLILYLTVMPRGILFQLTRSRGKRDLVGSEGHVIVK